MADAPEPSVRCSALVVICLLTSMPPLTMEIYIPSLPVLEEDLHTTTTLVLLTITVYTAAFSLMQLVLGPASDVYGRRKLLLISLGLYVASCIVNALSPTIELMLAPRVIQGSTSAAALIIGQAMLRDLLSIKKRENVTKWMAVVRSSSPMLAPVLGSLLAATLGWRSTFWALAGFGGLILLSSFHLLPESLPKERRQPKFSPYNLLHSVCFLMRRRDFLCWAVPEALGFSAVTAPGHGATFRLMPEDAPVEEVAWGMEGMGGIFGGDEVQQYLYEIQRQAAERRQSSPIIRGLGA